MEQDYTKDIYIDPDALDVEWLGQPNLFFRYAAALADQSRKTEQAKRDLDVITAEIDDEIRRHPETFLGEDVRPTENAIRNQVVQEKKVLDAQNKYHDAKHDEAMLTAAVRAMDQRKTALENLVRLQGQQYFAAPKEPRDLGMRWEERVQKDSAQRKIAAGLGNSPRRRQS
jgi:hypothetical protein